MLYLILVVCDDFGRGDGLCWEAGVVRVVKRFRVTRKGLLEVDRRNVCGCFEKMVLWGEGT